VSPQTYDELYPATITADRYGGIYSGGRWLAYPLFPNDLPDDPDSDDVTAASWWDENGDLPIGRGPTPDKAHNDLLHRLEAIEPVTKVRQTSKVTGSMWSWEIQWPNGETRPVSRIWSGKGRGPRWPA
jgi:hypothetical protein